MFVQVVIVTLIIIVLFKYISSLKQYVKAYYFYSKLPRASLINCFTVMFKALSCKETELFPLLEYLLKKVGGSSVSLIALHKIFTVILHPKDLEGILSSNVLIAKGDQYNTAKLWLNDGLLMSKGDKWRRRRKLLTPTFHFKILQDSLLVINENAKILADKFSKTAGEPIEIDKNIVLCTLDIISETAMGVKLDLQKDKAVEYVKGINRACKLIIKKEITLWFQIDIIFRLSPYYRELKRVISRLHAFTEKIIAERKEEFNKSRKQAVHKGDEKKRMFYLDCLLDTELREPGSFTDQDMREEVDTFMFEGHDTTAVAIGFCLFFLGLHTDVQEKTEEELNRIFGDSDRPVTMNDLTEMKYLELVIKETLRLFPSVPYFSRILTEDYTLENGKIIPSGTNVAIIPYIIHRNPKFYPNPLKFDPERFNEENSKDRLPFSYIPFSAGPRNCIGQKFAMMELKTVIATILRRNRLVTFTKWEEIKPVPRIVIKPYKPIKIQFFPRTS